MLRKNNRKLQEDLFNQCQGASWHGSSNFSAFCPFHRNVNTPAMIVYDNWFVCLSCGEQGPLEKLEKKLAGKVVWRNEEEVTKVVPEWKFYLDTYGSYQSTAKTAYKVGKEFPVLMDYIRKRGLGDLITPCKLGYMRGWMSFPVFDADGNFVDWVLRSTPSLETDVKYATRPRKNKKEGFSLYCPNWEKVFNSNEIYVPFGILDTLTLHLAGYPTATGLTGKSYQVSWFDDIRKRIWLIPDKEEEPAAYKFSRTLGWRAKVLCLDYPNGCKDPNDILTKFSLNDVRIIIEKAKEKHD